MGRAGEVKTKLLDPKLTETMVNNLSTKTGDTTSCVQLFLCKISPLVWGVQNSSRVSLEKLGDEASLPSIDQLTRQSETCEEKHPTCPLFKFEGVSGNSVASEDGGPEIY